MISDFDLEGKNKIQKASYYLNNYGMSYTVKKALKKLGIPVSQESEYMTWCRRMTPTKNALKEQQNRHFSIEPEFSVIYEEASGAEQWKKQTYSKYRGMKLGGMDAKNLLLKATGEYIVFVGKSVDIHPDFLYEVVKRLNEKESQPKSRIRRCSKGEPEVIYTDEDNADGELRFRPFFKPEISMQLLLNFQYLGRCFIVKKSLLTKIVREKGNELALQDNDWYDVALQSFRKAEHVLHIPKVLFSNLVNPGELEKFVRSTEEKQKLCVEKYLRDENICGKVISNEVPGFFHVEYELKEEPLVSIIIPNKDHAEDLKHCIESLRKKSDYQNYEIIVAENNSTDPATDEYYLKLQEDRRIRVVTYKGEFNYSAINNFAVKFAKGELLLFLNNDTEFIDQKGLRELVIAAVLPGCGASGAMLYYGDDTIQHGGVIIGMGGFAAHGLWSLRDRDENLYPFALCEREVSAVTGACLMVQKEVYEEVGGMGEDFVVALNDVDLCLKIRAAGHEIIFNPYAKLHHYESKSRGYEDTQEKQARFQQEITRLQQKWEDEITAGDPYYNPNLTLHRADYSMDI